MHINSKLKGFLTLLSLITTLNAQSIKQDGYLQILAKDLQVNNQILTANGDVVVYSPSYYITANKFTYDKEKSTLELFDDVGIVQNNQLATFSQYAFIDNKNQSNILEPALILDNKTQLWFNASKAIQDKEKYNLKNSTVSSCDCENPAWSVYFTSGDYDTKEQWVNTYNTTLFIRDIPVLYTPYFGFPTDTTRRTGFLRPTIGFSQSEGLLYAQPIYFAPKDSFDFEYIPQLRNQRGFGHELKYRWADSQYSMLKIDGAIFKEKQHYVEEYLLENDKHYGWNLNYLRTKLFSTDNDKDGLYIDYIDMNDVDYINTKYNNDSNSYTDKYLDSIARYYYSTNDFLGSLELKYYNDISEDNNDDTIQDLPVVNLNKYSSELFSSNFTYALNFNYKNKTRQEGLKAQVTYLELPLTYSFNILNDYLTFTLSEKINFTNIAYDDEDLGYDLEDGNYGENIHYLKLSTDLIKEYDDVLHTINLSSSYTLTDSFKDEGDISGINSEDPNLESFAISKTENKFLSLGLSQTVINKDDLSSIIEHKISQSFIYNTSIEAYVKNDLINDITIYFTNTKLANRIKYNHKINKVINSSSTLTYKDSTYYASIYHLFTKGVDKLDETEDIKYKLGFDFLKYYSLYYAQEYDLIYKISKKKEIGFGIDKKCWALDLKFADSIVASNTTNHEPLNQKIVYITVDFKKLFQIDQKYKFKERN